MKNIIKFEYDGNPISFNQDGWINATEVASRNGKRVNEWLRLHETMEYMAAIAKVLGMHFDPPLLQRKSSKKVVGGKSGFRPQLNLCNDLVDVRRGSPKQGGGTWLHPKLAVVFARWISVSFAVQCDMYIESILFGDMTVYENYKNACNALEAAQKEASKCGKGLAKFRWQKPQLVHSVGYWHEQLELPLLKAV